MCKMILLITVTAGTLVGSTNPVWSDESVGQERLAYHELNRIRSLSKSNVDYKDYKKALESPRLYVSLLHGPETTVTLLHKVMSYYEQALSVWSLRADSELPVDSLNTADPNGAAILRQCPDITRYNILERDQVYVLDAVKCIWNQADELLNRAPDYLQ